MPDLDATADPVTVVPGDPAGLHEVAWAFGAAADALQEVADGLTRLGTPDGWWGAAAERFRSALAVQPDRWADAARAHRDAADALEEHAVVLERAQRQAADAADGWRPGIAGDPGRQDAVLQLADARRRVAESGDRAAAAVGTARDRAPEGPQVSVAAQLGNVAASLGNALLRHPADALGLAAGTSLAAVGAAGVVGSVALDATVVGAVGGIPLGGVSAAGVAAGVGLAGASAIDLALNGAGPDRVQPFGVNTDAEPAGAEPAAPPFPPPKKVTGLTKHGEEQVMGRNGGVGVSDEAIEDAVANPTLDPEYQPSPDTYLFTGKDAQVVLNEQGRVVTAWPKTQTGHRNR